jgi:flagellar hook-basal body complex protein FliE
VQISPIQGINSQISPIHALTAQKGAMGTGETKDKLSFHNLMMSHIKTVSETLDQSVEDKNKLVRGELKNPHDAAISGLKAGLMLRLTTSICSKISSAVTTLFQMQI